MNPEKFVDTPGYIKELRFVARQFDAAILVGLGLDNPEETAGQIFKIGITNDGYVNKLMVQRGLGDRLHYIYEESINKYNGGELPDFAGFNSLDRLIWESAEPCSYSWGIVYISAVINAQYAELCVASEPNEIQTTINRITDQAWHNPIAKK